MAETTEYVNETLLEENLRDIWPDNPCLFDVRSPIFKDREKREDAIIDTAFKLSKVVRHFDKLSRPFLLVLFLQKRMLSIAEILSKMLRPPHTMSKLPRVAKNIKLV